MKKQYDKLSQPSVQRYSPALTLDRIWAINADSYYERHYNWSENGVAVPDSQTGLAYDCNVIVAIRTLSGKGLLALENERFELTENTLIFFYINQPRLYKTLTPFWNMHWIEFRIDQIFFPLNTVLSIKASKREKTFISEVSRSLNKDNPQYAAALFSAQLVNWIQQSDYPKKSYELLMDEITRFINEHFTESIDVEFLAHKFGLSSQYMRTIFRRTTNMTPGRFIIELRIKKAKELLATSDMKIEAVAQSVGFSNQYYFNRCFKKHTGFTPGVWREKTPPPRIIV